jgi:hypothetical protein
MNGMGAISVRIGKNGSKWQAEQICGGLFCPGPDPAELRTWVADDTELGKRVADDFLGVGRCLPGTLDLHFFEVQLRKFPDPDDALKRRAGLGKACLCQDNLHYRPQGLGDNRVHCGSPAGTPLNGLFWTAHITSRPAPAAKATSDGGCVQRSRPASRRPRRRQAGTPE